MLQPRLFPALEAEFEEDGWPIALIELDEAEDLEEISLYVDGDTAGVERRMAGILRKHDLPRTISREELPDVDWVSRSLEGLKPVRAARFFVHGSHDRHRAASATSPSRSRPAWRSAPAITAPRPAAWR